MKFIGKLEVTELNDGINHELDADFGFWSSFGRIIAKKGFVTDYASIPPLARIAGVVMAAAWLFGWLWLGLAAWVVVMLADSLLHTGSYQRAAVIHDWIYRHRTFSRAHCDEILFQAMGVCGTPNWKRFVIWANVRLFGWICWHAPRRKAKSNAR